MIRDISWEGYEQRGVLPPLMWLSQLQKLVQATASNAHDPVHVLALLGYRSHKTRVYLTWPEDVLTLSDAGEALRQSLVQLKLDLRPIAVALALPGSVTASGDIREEEARMQLLVYEDRDRRRSLWATLDDGALSGFEPVPEALDIAGWKNLPPILYRQEADRAVG